MYLFNILALQILDAVGRIEAWIESSILDNEDSPLITTLGLGLALLFGLWSRYGVSLFRIEADGFEPKQFERTGDRRRPEGGREEAEYRFDLHGRLVEIPCGADKLMGSDPETMIGAPFSRFLQEKDVRPVVDGFIRVLRGESVTDLRVRLRTSFLLWFHADALDGRMTKAPRL